MGLSSSPITSPWGSPSRRRDRTSSKQAELKEFWGINVEQEASVTGMEDHRARLHELQKQYRMTEMLREQNTETALVASRQS